MKIGQTVLKLSRGKEKWRRTDRRTNVNQSSDSITNSFIELTDPINLALDTNITFLSAIVMDI